MSAPSISPGSAPETSATPTRVGVAAEALAAKEKQFRSYSINVFLTTLLFIVIIVTGSGWTQAVNKQFEGKSDSWKYWVFALGMTVFTILAAIVIGELSQAFKQKTSVDVSTVFTDAL